ncbi:tannase and feruloyl esterase [Stagonosporopsis vannaccii]|nr:tannase and feruloyl esterase [Stagonosporopsis vannaccii]
MVYFAHILPLALAALLPAIHAAIPHRTFEERCSAFASELDLANVTVYASQYLTKGANVSLSEFPQECVEAQGSSTNVIIMSELCRVTMRVETSDKSEVTIEAWLPSNWTGRFLTGGNGGFSGCIQYPDLSYGAKAGFATISGNNGHNGTTAQPFYQNPDVLEDYVYRATYQSGVVGKAVTAAFYAKDVSRSYFMGCSGGGRQALKMAQSFPEIFDGILAMAPAIDFVNLINIGGWLTNVAGSTNSTGFITESLWKVVHKEVMNQCDGLDGALDGIIEDTDLCHPTFETLICNETATNGTECLTGAQAERLRTFYEPLYGNNGTRLYPRLQPGTETVSYSTYFAGFTPSSLAADWYKYAVYDPSFDPTTLNRDDFELANAQNPFNIRTYETDLSAFKNRGGKLLAMHGMEDYIISSEISTQYYHDVAQSMSMSPAALDSFYRYFRVSGMSHCAQGNGAWSLGMYGIGNPQSALDQNPDDNVLARIVAWVERDEAPEFVRGATVGTSPSFKRKHCKYPTRNVYFGPGNYTDENAWSCQG